MIKVELLGPVIAYRAPSMIRYGEELLASLQTSAVANDVHATRALVPSATPRAKQQSKLSLRVRRVRELLQPYRPLPRRARDSDADLFHLIDSGDAHLLRGFPANRTIVTCHDVMAALDSAQRGGAASRSRIENWRLGRWRQQLARAGRIVCVSESTRSDVLRTIDIPETRVSVVANGIRSDFRRLSPDDIQAERSHLPGTYVMMHVASGWQPYKNFVGTVRVLKALRDRNLDVTLVRAGVPLPTEVATEAEALGVDQHIVERGRVSDEALVSLYNAADVLLFPSFYEGFGWPPLEAMACGTPVVVSTTPALRETVADAGLSADARDVGGLADAVATVLTDPLVRNDLISRGRKRVAGFSWEATARALADVYQQMHAEALAGSSSSSS